MKSFPDYRNECTRGQTRTNEENEELFPAKITFLDFPPPPIRGGRTRNPEEIKTDFNFWRKKMKLILPLEVMIPRKTMEDKRVILNLNIYRNAHHMTLNQAKIKMAKHVELALGHTAHCGERPSPPFKFIYTIFPATGRAFDLGNVGSILQKFTDDALIDLGVIKDDNYKIVREVVYRFGGVDKENPRAELDISEF